MAEIVEKINDIPNYVTWYFQKEKINLKRTVIIDQVNIAACKNRTNSMCSECELLKIGLLLDIPRRINPSDVLPGLHLHLLKGYLIMRLPIWGSLKWLKLNQVLKLVLIQR